MPQFLHCQILQNLLRLNVMRLMWAVLMQEGQAALNSLTKGNIVVNL